MAMRCFDGEIVDRLIASCVLKNELFFDIEASSVSVSMDDWRLWGIGISDGTTAVYVPVEAPLCRKVAEAIWSFKCDVVGHNPKFDMEGIKKEFRLSDYPDNPVCTLIALNLVDENLQMNQVGLKPSVKRLFGIEMEEFEDAVKFGKDSEEFENYCCEDCLKDSMLWNWLKVKMRQVRTCVLIQQMAY